MNRHLSRLALAALLLGGAAASPIEASAARAKFRCVGVGRGGHAKGMTQAECRRAGGTVEKLEEEEREPARERRERAEPRETRESGAQPGFFDRLMNRDDRDAGERRDRRGDAGAPRGPSDFSCRGIGTGRHYAGMTKAECERMGGTVWERR